MDESERSDPYWQAHVYAGPNFRDVGMRAILKLRASITTSPERPIWVQRGKALLAQHGANLDAPSKANGDLRKALFVDCSRKTMCLGGFMAAEYDDLAHTVTAEVQAFADVNVAWLTRMFCSRQQA